MTGEGGEMQRPSKDKDMNKKAQEEGIKKLIKKSRGLESPDQQADQQSLHKKAVEEVRRKLPPEEEKARAAVLEHFNEVLNSGDPDKIAELVKRGIEFVQKKEGSSDVLKAASGAFLTGAGFAKKHGIEPSEAIKKVAEALRQ